LIWVTPRTSLGTTDLHHKSSVPQTKPFFEAQHKFASPPIAEKPRNC